MTPIEALERIKALKDGYKGADMGRVAGYRVCGELAEQALAALKVGASVGAEPIGYVNVYRAEDGTLETGAADIYSTVEEARDFDASEFEEHVGVYALVPVGADVGA